MDRSRKTYLVVLVGSGLWCGLFFAAPLLRSVDSAISAPLYHTFSHVCHQFPDRCFFIAGEPLAVCVRCSLLYLGFFASLLVYPFFSRRHNFVPAAKLLLLAFLPMALDVGLQFAGLSQSTAWTRAVTGSLAGTVLPFLVLPPLQEAIQQLSAHFGDSTHARKTR